jgi:hypothetical protein
LDNVVKSHVVGTNFKYYKDRYRSNQWSHPCHQQGNVTLITKRYPIKKGAIAPFFIY